MNIKFDVIHGSPGWIDPSQTPTKTDQTGPC